MVEIFFNPDGTWISTFLSFIHELMMGQNFLQSHVVSNYNHDAEPGCLVINKPPSSACLLSLQVARRHVFLQAYQDVIGHVGL